MLQYLLMFLMSIVGIFLILLVMIQRGRGGGLAGAFGGMGGQSAFGTKAGDLFTRITIVSATIWILLCTVSVKLLSTPTSLISSDQGKTAPLEEVPGAAGGKSDDKKPGATGESDASDKSGKSEASDAAPATEATESEPAATKSATPPAEKPADSK
jgi:preprotein translocase subunit SecG